VDSYVTISKLKVVGVWEKIEMIVHQKGGDIDMLDAH